MISTRLTLGTNIFCNDFLGLNGILTMSRHEHLFLLPPTFVLVDIRFPILSHTCIFQLFVYFYQQLSRLTLYVIWINLSPSSAFSSSLTALISSKIDWRVRTLTWNPIWIDGWWSRRVTCGSRFWSWRKATSLITKAVRLFGTALWKACCLINRAPHLPCALYEISSIPKYKSTSFDTIIRVLKTLGESLENWKLTFSQVYLLWIQMESFVVYFWQITVK